MNSISQASIGDYCSTERVKKYGYLKLIYKLDQGLGCYVVFKKGKRIIGEFIPHTHIVEIVRKENLFSQVNIKH